MTDETNMNNSKVRCIEEKCPSLPYRIMYAKTIVYRIVYVAKLP